MNCLISVPPSPQIQSQPSSASLGARNLAIYIGFLTVFKKRSTIKLNWYKGVSVQLNETRKFTHIYVNPPTQILFITARCSNYLCTYTVWIWICCFFFISLCNAVHFSFNYILILIILCTFYVCFVLSTDYNTNLQIYVYELMSKAHACTDWNVKSRCNAYCVLRVNI